MFSKLIWIVTIIITINCINKNFINPQIAYMDLQKKNSFFKSLSATIRKSNQSLTIVCFEYFLHKIF